MNALDNFLVQDFLDDMADTVGVRNWLLYAFVSAVVTWGLWGGSIIPYGGIIGLVMTANLLFALVVAAWWKYRGRPKRDHISIVDLGRQKGRNQ